jgi:hypothetical protein
MCPDKARSQAQRTEQMDNSHKSGNLP